MSPCRRPFGVSPLSSVRLSDVQSVGSAASVAQTRPDRIRFRPWRKACVGLSQNLKAGGSAAAPWRSTIPHISVPK
eukprot:scaffold4445_cov105-Pinguiococcus_pyrenoidosus.AAC.1